MPSAHFGGLPGPRVADLLTVPGVTRDRLRYWVQLGLFPKCRSTGRYAHYPLTHVRSGQTVSTLTLARELAEFRDNAMTYADLRDAFYPEDGS